MNATETRIKTTKGLVNIQAINFDVDRDDPRRYTRTQRPGYLVGIYGICRQNPDRPMNGFAVVHARTGKHFFVTHKLSTCLDILAKAADRFPDLDTICEQAATDDPNLDSRKGTQIRQFVRDLVR